MEYLISGTTSTYYPTYMNPDNGAIYAPVTSSFTSRARSTYAVGAAYETYATVESWSSFISPSPTPSPSPSPAPSATEDPSMAYDDESAYAAWIATANANSSSIAIESPSATSSAKSMSPLKIASVGVPSAVGLVLLVVGIWCCCRCRRRRKNRRDEPGQEGGASRGYGEMREVNAGLGGHGNGTGYDRERPHSLTRNEVMGVISSPGNRPRPTQSGYPYTTQPTPNYVDNRRYLTPSIGGSRHSRWTDDSEFDVMAEDGSTITRTLSTTSTRRSLATVTESPAIDENPFDHPAYTYRSAPQQVQLNRAPGLSRNGTLSSQGTWSTQLPPLSFQSETQSQAQTQSPITPLTPTAAPTYIQPTHSTQRQADTYSIHSSEDGEIYGAPSRPGLRREPTIIRHSDSTLVQGARVEKRGRDGVVELPPLYEDATSGWSR